MSRRISNRQSQELQMPQPGWMYSNSSFRIYHPDTRSYDEVMVQQPKQNSLLTMEQQRAKYIREEQIRQDEKKRLKRAANRRSACTSRVRKKQFVEETTQQNHRLQKYAKILSAAPPTITIDEKGFIRFATRTCLRLFHLDQADELLGICLASLFEEDDALKIWLDRVNTELDTSNEYDRQENLNQADTEILTTVPSTNNVVTASSSSDDERECGTSLEEDAQDITPPPCKRTKVDRTRLGSGGGLGNLDAAAIFKLKSTGRHLFVACGGSFAGRRQLSENKIESTMSCEKKDDDDFGSARELVLSIRPVEDPIWTGQETKTDCDDNKETPLLGMTCSLQSTGENTRGQRSLKSSNNSPSRSTTATTIKGSLTEKPHTTFIKTEEQAFTTSDPRLGAQLPMLHFNGPGHTHHSDFHARAHNSQMRQFHTFLQNISYPQPQMLPQMNEPPPFVATDTMSTFTKLSPPIAMPSHTEQTRPQKRIEQLCSANSTPSDVQNAVESLILISRRDSVS
uniref:BZIP domain-containing protein n=1 Tax=Aureoumbra lagunensis TaxID=44058 RepID=A0A7S3NJ69_9STRA|mmetsp:Transcript_20872/g.27069  ORF Transcript_20872/g.27069 Transcript_20872/m.27069 type:complete len:512 (+) Transcript_20872:61-1596(+)